MLMSTMRVMVRYRLLLVEYVWKLNVWKDGDGYHFFRVHLLRVRRRGDSYLFAQRYGGESWVVRGWVMVVTGW